MTTQSWKALRSVIRDYRAYVRGLAESCPDLGGIIGKLVNEREGPKYAVDNPVLYNFALDEISADSEIKLILVADNPGRREQAQENRRYLVGPSGKIAEKFFRDNPGLGIDFRKNVIILNKTPVHTPRTADLKELCRIGGGSVTDAVLESQRKMAELLLEFHRALSPGTTGGASVPVWIIGYSEMKRGGIFEAYTETLKDLYPADNPLRGNIFFYRHFSMNQFTIDLKQHSAADPAFAALPLARALRLLGESYRQRVLGLPGLIPQARWN